MKIFFWVILALMMVYSIQRFVFIIYNYAEFDFSKSTNLLKVLMYGMRFDLSSVLLTNSLFAVLWFIPVLFRIQYKWYQTLLFVLFFFVNTIFVAINFIDIVYFPFVQKRIQSDALLFVTGAKGTEFYNLLPVFLFQFWFIWLTLLAVLVGLYLFWIKCVKPSFGKPSSAKFSLFPSLLLIVFFGLFILGTRGGVQLRPLSLLDAAAVGGFNNTPFILNSTFSLIRTLDKARIEEKNYVLQKDFSTCDYPFEYIQPTGDSLQKPINLVFIIVESLSQQYLSYYEGTSKTPFLDSLMKESLVFLNGFANARESVQGIPSVLASLPHLMDDPFIFSRYSSNKIESVAYILKKHQYSSAFFHGASNGTMGFLPFVTSGGFEEYFGLEEYPVKEHFDGSWGIWDHHFLPFMVDKISDMKQPFVTSVLTLTSHHPFILPKDFTLKTEIKNHPILNTIQYSDNALRIFFEKAKKTDWYKNTLFIITADHTGPNTKDQLKPMDAFRVPIIFYSPDGKLKGVEKKIMSHIDIIPTALPLMGIKDSIFSFGNNYFDKSCKKKVINYKAGIYQITNDDFHLLFDGEKSIGLYEWKKDELFGNNLILSQKHSHIVSELETQIKKSIQNYHHVLLKDKMTFDRYSVKQ
ncbi:MAG: sulfatase-like hydrolase/transferase [Saprospiraceae bacterium]|nr:sulfatase-like hydrolase/transferase [Saprospiraceae bacterium]